MVTTSGASQKLAFNICAHLRICCFSFIVQERGRASGYGFPGRAWKPVKFFNLKSQISNLKSMSGPSQKLAFNICAHLRICCFSFIVQDRGRASGYGFPGRAWKPVKFFNLKSQISNLKSMSGPSQKLAFDICAHLRICCFSFIVHELGRASGYGFPGRAWKPVKFFNLKSKI
jgi:hypothetical protein